MDDARLIARYIDDEHRWAGDARLRDYGISVWALIATYLVTNESVEAVAHEYQLPRQAVEAVVAYYRQHRAAIDARIAQHDAAFA